MLFFFKPVFFSNCKKNKTKVYLEKIFQKIKMLIALGKQTMFVIFSREKEIVYGYWFSGFSKFTYYVPIY